MQSSQCEAIPASCGVMSQEPRQNLNYNASERWSRVTRYRDAYDKVLRNEVHFYHSHLDKVKNIIYAIKCICNSMRVPSVYLSSWDQEGSSLAITLHCTPRHKLYHLAHKRRRPSTVCVNSSDVRFSRHFPRRRIVFTFDEWVLSGQQF